MGQIVAIPRRWLHRVISGAPTLRPEMPKGQEIYRASSQSTSDGYPRSILTANNCEGRVRHLHHVCQITEKTELDFGIIDRSLAWPANGVQSNVERRLRGRQFGTATDHCWPIAPVRRSVTGYRSHPTGFDPLPPVATGGFRESK